MKYRCHQCFGLVEVEELAHVDLYFDLCWLQCTTCEAAFGPACGMDHKANPHPHGYLQCPFRGLRADCHGAFLPDLHVVG